MFYDYKAIFIYDMSAGYYLTNPFKDSAKMEMQKQLVLDLKLSRHSLNFCVY